MNEIAKLGDDVLIYDERSKTYLRRNGQFNHARLTLTTKLDRDMIVAIADHILGQEKKSKKKIETEEI